MMVNVQECYVTVLLSHNEENRVQQVRHLENIVEIRDHHHLRHLRCGQIVDGRTADLHLSDDIRVPRSLERIHKAVNRLPRNTHTLYCHFQPIVLDRD